jgi:hypothetical protein
MRAAADAEFDEGDFPDRSGAAAVAGDQGTRMRGVSANCS